MTIFSGAVFCELKALIFPTLDASNHFLNPATKFRKIESRPVGPVTMWAIAIHNEERFEKQHSSTITSSMLGAFREKETRDEFLALIRTRHSAF